MCRAKKELIEDGRLEGFERGQTAGFEQGQIHILSNLVHENVINLSEAAKQMGITEKDFLEVMNTEFKENN